jgi:hypothetical protein
LTVTGGNLFIPFVFTLLIGLEKYSNKNSELFLNRARYPNEPFLLSAAQPKNTLVNPPQIWK